MLLKIKLLIYNSNSHKITTNYSEIWFLEIRESFVVIRGPKRKTRKIFSKMFAVLKKVVLLPRNSQAEFLK